MRTLRRLRRGEIGLGEAVKVIWRSGCRRLGIREFGWRYFEEIYRVPDPWQYETSPYERRKYEATLAALPRERFEHVLEIGCSIGVFTEMVAARADRMTAVDISAAAVEETKRRCAHLDHVRVRRADFLALQERATFDLILAAEILYFMWQPLRLRRKVRERLISFLTAGGILVVVWGGYRLEQDWDAFLLDDGRLRMRSTKLVEDPERPYRISLFEKACGLKSR